MGEQMEQYLKVLATYYPHALAIASTIALFLSGRTKYRKDIAQSIIEASSTWHDVAEARKERIAELLQENNDLKAELKRLKTPRRIGGKP